MQEPTSAYRVLILGSRRGVRRLDRDQSLPLALTADRRGGRALDWTLRALADAGAGDVVFVGGYHLERVVQHYASLRFRYDPEWEDGDALGALRCAADEVVGRVLLVSADVVVRSRAIERLVSSRADVAIARWEPVPGEAELEDPGLILLSALAADALRERLGSGNGAPTGLADVLHALGFGVDWVEVGADARRIGSSQALSRFVFGTKAQTLERLRPMVRSATILDQVAFKVGEWRLDADAWQARIAARFPQRQLVIRSSALCEDGWTASQAGRFASVLGVDAGDPGAVTRAVEAVVASYARAHGGSDDDQVLVQPQLEGVTCAGVALTRDPGTGAPYLIVNYDNASGRTDGVTSGMGTRLRTAVVYKRAPLPRDPAWLGVLCAATRELEELSCHDDLDIEFAFDAEGTCYILQVRVLPVGRAREAVDDGDVAEELAALEGYLGEHLARAGWPVSTGTLLANMPDWNPAELVGVCPRPLALSLYQRLIGESAWAAARAEIGYRDTFPEPLVVALGGHPYVDVRASFASFLPADLPIEIGTRVVERCLAHLRARPELHDKVEFDVVPTCLDFDFEQHRARLAAAGLEPAELDVLRASLGRLTARIVVGPAPSIAELLARVDRLAARREQWLTSRRGGIFSTVRAVDLLLADCERFGTVPFAMLARYAFVATSFLRSMVTQRALAAADLERLLRAIPTVAGELARHVELLRAGALDRDAFVARYGHLRPGTFELSTPSYGEALELYLGGGADGAQRWGAPSALDDAGAILAPAADAVDALLREGEFGFESAVLFDFIRKAIPARERAKFEYTKNLSAALGLLAELGDSLGLDAELVGWIPIQRLLEVSTASPSHVLGRELSRLATFNQKRHRIHRALRLPHLIARVEDVACFELAACRPNFVTTRRIVADAVDLDLAGARASSLELEGRIVLVRGADPGWDWLFAHGIAGLVTELGGVASHMAIRAAELGLPAAIGCGELIYTALVGAARIELDCGARHVRRVR